jgi:enoyl-CoA hydratase/carnithine racemase
LGRASELLLLGDKVDSESAERIGIANRVVEDDELEAASGELAARLASGPTFAYGATKLLLTRELDLDLGGSLELEAMTQALLMTSEDHKEFYAAFKEGRNPVWTGR